MKVVILAGGKGTRLGLDGIPKPMVPVNGKPLLEILVENVKASGFKDFVFLNGYLGNVIEEHFGNGEKWCVNITHITEKTPLGTAGAFKEIESLLNEPFIVLYGDILIDFDFRHFADYAINKGGVGTLLVHPNDHPFDSDLLEADENGRIIKFHPKPREGNERLPNLVNAAIYYLTPKALEYVEAGVSSDWGRDIFKKLAESEVLYSYRSIEYAKDIGTKDRIIKGENHMNSGYMERLSRRYKKPVVFLDRDGVINIEKDGIKSPNEMELIPDVAMAISYLNKAGIPVICITNQPGIAKGQINMEDLRKIHAEMDCQLAEQGHSWLDDIHVCPHHPEKGWEGEIIELKIDCECRKPKSGMLLTAAEFHNIDLEKSWLIGDRYCDIKAAKNVGCNAILVKTGHAGHDKDKYDIEADFIAEDGAQAIKIILEKLK